MNSAWLGEFLGTMMLVLLGDGVVAGVVLKRSKAEGSGWMVITAGWAFAVMAGVFTAIACGSSAAHLNPEIGRASCRERVEISVGAVSLKKKKQDKGSRRWTCVRAHTSAGRRRVRC